MTTHSHDDIFSVVLQVKEAVLGVKGEMINLREHVNERNEAIEAHIAILEGQINGKVSNNDLLSSIGFKALNVKGVRWVIGAVTIASLSTLVGEHWYPVIERVINALLS